MSESGSEDVSKSSATPKESLQPGSSTQATPRLDEERIIAFEPEPVPSTSGIGSKGKMPVHPRSRIYKKKRENLEESIISAFQYIKISGQGNEYDSSDDDYFGDGFKEEVEVEEDEKEKEKDKEKEKNRRKRIKIFGYDQDENVMLELSINPRDTYPQADEEEDEPRPSTSFGTFRVTGTPGNEEQPVSEENFIEEDASALAQGSPPSYLSRIPRLSDNVMTGVPFHHLRVSKGMTRHLRVFLGITTASILQEKAIPILMWEKDAFLHAGSGSGKTLAFTIPLIHNLLLIKPRVRREDGIRILVVVPNKECAQKTYETFTFVLRHAPWIEVGQLGGGDRYKVEKETVRRGAVILIATPMRFLDHIQHTTAMFLKNLSCLVVDGLDEIFEQGNQKHLWDVITVLDKGLDYLHHPDHDVAHFTGMNTTDPMMIDDKLDSPPRQITFLTGKTKDEKPPPPLYNQFFMIVPERMKLVALVGFVMWKYKVANERRILIFAGTQTMADYFAHLLSLAYGKKEFDCEADNANKMTGLEIHSLNPFMSHQEKLDLFGTFSRTKCGVLFCTDSAVKGVDLPRVDWVIQLHAPTCSADYMARIGMASPGFQIGPSVTLLLPAEKDYVQELKSHDVPLTSIRVRQPFRHLWTFYPPSHTIDDMTLEIQTKLEDIVHRTPGMRDKACLAFASWCRLYSSYPQNVKHIFRFTYVHMDNYVHFFGLRELAAFAISQARKLHSDIRRKSAKKRSAPPEDDLLPLEPSAKLPFPLMVPSAPLPLPAPPPIAAQPDDDMFAAPLEGDHAGSKKRKNDEEMEQSGGEEGHLEKRSK